MSEHQECDEMNRSESQTYKHAVYESQIWSTRFLEQDNVYSNSLQAGHANGLLKRILGINILLQTGVCFENVRRNSCNFIGSGQLSNSEKGWLIQTAILNAV